VTANGDFWSPNTLHDYTEGNVVSIIGDAAPAEPAHGSKVILQAKVEPGARYKVTFDMVAPASGAGQAVRCSFYEKQSFDTATAVLTWNTTLTCDDTWRHVEIPVYVHPNATNFSIAWYTHSFYAPAANETGFAIANVELVKVAD
jgi:hypothetical protein